MNENRAKILVLDGDERSREPLVARLRASGHTVHAAATLQQAIQASQAAEDLDLLVLDLGSAQELLLSQWVEDLRHGEPTPPVIAMSHRLTPEVCRHAVKMRAIDILEKPIAAGTGLEALVDRACAERERDRVDLSRRHRDQDTILRLREQLEEVKQRFTIQQRSFEESQEVFYLDLSRMMTILDNIMDGIVFADRDGRLTLMNPVAENLLAIKSFVAIGKRAPDITGRADLLKAIVEDHAQVLGRRQVTRTIEVHHSEKDLVYLKLQTTAVTDYKGTLAGILTVIQDVTSEFKTDQLKNQYLSIVSHELRTPLTGIKTFATMLGKGVLGKINERQERVVASIREQSLRLEHQIDKLINLGRLEADDFGQDLELFSVDDLVRVAVEPFQPWASDKSVTLTVQGPAAPVYVRADREDIKRALQALVENAVKFTPEQGSVEVSAALVGESVVFRVKDRGIGIDPRYHKRIFEKFFQVEDPLTRHYGGAGLGLCVAKGVVEAHGSRIELQSKLGDGADFSFKLPRHHALATGDSKESSEVMVLTGPNRE